VRSTSPPGPSWAVDGASAATGRSLPWAASPRVGWHSAPCPAEAAAAVEVEAVS